MAVGIRPLMQSTDGQDFRAFSHQYQHDGHHKCWCGEQAAPESHCHLEPALSQPWDRDKASTAPPALPAAWECSWSSPGTIWGDLPTPPVRSSISAAAQHRRCQGLADPACRAGTCQGSPPAVPTRRQGAEGTRGENHQLKHQPQRWEELSPDNQRRLFSYCAVS